jgi:hypothetical protein
MGNAASASPGRADRPPAHEEDARKKTRGRKPVREEDDLLKDGKKNKEKKIEEDVALQIGGTCRVSDHR